LKSVDIEVKEGLVGLVTSYKLSIEFDSEIPERGYILVKIPSYIQV